MRPYITKQLCDNCAGCVDICPYEVFSKHNDCVEVTSPEDCIECVSCVEQCPNNAIFMDDYNAEKDDPPSR